MAWRTIVIENPARLSLKDNKLIISNESGDADLPLEDIDSLLIDSYGVTLTSNLLSELASSGVAVTVCDAKHTPSTVVLSYSQHSRQAKISRDQLAMTEPFKKQLWQKIVERKVANQAGVLEYFHLPSADKLRGMSKRVRSGDVGNIEAQAARIYFIELFEDATRRQPTWHNSALNYGYAIVRSCVARSIASRGLIASQGIFHHSELNSFNLVDDLIECFRPFVDLFIIKNITPEVDSQQSENLSREDRAKLLDILSESAIIEDKKYQIRHATDILVESFVSAIEQNSITYLKLPEIIEK